MRLKIYRIFLFVVLGFVIYSMFGCAGFPARPAVPVYSILVQADASGNVIAAKAHGFKLSDYDENGHINANAQAQNKTLKSILELRGWTCMDVAGLQAFKTWMADVRSYAKEKCQ